MPEGGGPPVQYLDPQGVVLLKRHIVLGGEVDNLLTEGGSRSPVRPVWLAFQYVLNHLRGFAKDFTDACRRSAEPFEIWPRAGTLPRYSPATGNSSDLAFWAVPGSQMALVFQGGTGT